MTIVGKVTGLLSADQNDDAPASNQPDRNRARLYACDDCSTTFISADMDSCPSCGDSIDRIPTERDLGMV